MLYFFYVLHNDFALVIITLAVIVRLFYSVSQYVETDDIVKLDKITSLIHLVNVGKILKKLCLILVIKVMAL